MILEILKLWAEITAWIAIAGVGYLIFIVSLAKVVDLIVDFTSKNPRRNSWIVGIGVLMLITLGVSTAAVVGKYYGIL